MNEREIIHNWVTFNGTIEVVYDKWLYLAVFHNGRMVGANLSVGKAQEIVNRIATTRIWG